LIYHSGFIFVFLIFLHSKKDETEQRINWACCTYHSGIKF